MNTGISAHPNAPALHFSFNAAGAPRAAMSLAAAGDMGFGDDENRFRRDQWLRDTGFDPGRAAAPDLIHSRIVVEDRMLRRPGGAAAGMSARQGPGGPSIEADGIISSGRCHNGQAAGCLVITVADCMPVFLFDADSGAFGLLHSGWKGTGILKEAVMAMARLYGSRPGNVSALFGPRIGSCCYRVDEERAAGFEAEFGFSAVLRADDGPRLDLVAANLAIAEKLGLRSVEVVDGCTCCDSRFGSFRRQGPGRFTRMAAVISY